MVDWISEIGERYHLNPTTVHVAVRLHVWRSVRASCPLHLARRVVSLQVVCTHARLTPSQLSALTAPLGRVHGPFPGTGRSASPPPTARGTREHHDCRYAVRERAVDARPRSRSLRANRRTTLPLSHRIFSAAKYEEAEDGVPSAERLVREADGTFDVNLLPQMEVLMLNCLRWSLTVVTPRHILGLFHRMGVVFDDDTVAYKSQPDKQVRREPCGDSCPRPIVVNRRFNNTPLVNPCLLIISYSSTCASTPTSSPTSACKALSSSKRTSPRCLPARSLSPRVAACSFVLNGTQSYVHSRATPRQI